MNINKKALSLVLAVSLVIGTCSGTAAYAAGTKTITVGNGGDQATLEDAIQIADSGDTIRLLSDLTVTESVAINKAVILDGNGKTITADNGGESKGFIPEYIQDQNVTLTEDTPARVLDVTANGATVENVTLSGEIDPQESHIAAGIYVYNHTGVTLKDITTSSFQASDFSACGIYVNGDSQVTLQGTISTVGQYGSSPYPAVYVRSTDSTAKRLIVSAGADIKTVLGSKYEKGSLTPVLEGAQYDLMVSPVLVQLNQDYTNDQSSAAKTDAAKLVDFEGSGWDASFIPELSKNQVQYYHNHVFFYTTVSDEQAEEPNNPVSLQRSRTGVTMSGLGMDSMDGNLDAQIKWTSSDTKVIAPDTADSDSDVAAFTFPGKGTAQMEADLILTAGSDEIDENDNSLYYWHAKDTWDFTGYIDVTVGESGGNTDSGSVSDAIDNLKDSSTSADVAAVVAQVLGLSSDERDKLTSSEIQKLEGLILSVSGGKITSSIPAPVTGDFKDSGALPEAPTATGLLLAAGVTGNESAPVAVTLATTQKPAISGSLLTIDFTLTKQVGSNPAETIHTTLPFPVTVSIRLPANSVKQETYTYVVSHSKTDGTTVKLPVIISGTSGNYIATFTTDSFSTFSIVGTYNGGSSGGSGSGSGSHHSSGGSSSGSSSGSGSSATGTSTAATFMSDTNQDFSVNGAYQFKITSTNGVAPSLVVGTSGVFEAQLVSTSGNDYFFKLTAIGKPGDKAGIYVNGVKLLVATVGTTASLVKSDTIGSFRISKGKTYVFKLTADSKPSLVSGNSSIFQVKFIKQSGKNYFYQTTAVGKVGQTAGFYINSGKTPVTVATITDPAKNYKSDTGAKLTVKSGKTYQFKITASSKPTFACGNGSAFKVKYTGSKGSDYFFKVTATGKVGQAAGFYVNGEKAPCTVATIA